MKTLLFVDDEKRVLQGLQRQLHGMRHEWDMHFSDNAQSALAFMTERPIDVIVTDMMMPQMDGAELLTEVSKRYPNTVRIVLSGFADQEAILKIVGPAHQYLSKPCNPEELRTAIGRAFALRELLANDELKRLVTRVKTLPTLPVLYQQLTDELNNEHSSMERIGEIISQDIGMTTKILQLVNSSFFGLSQPVNSSSEAVMYLGISTVRSLVLSLQVFSQLKSPPVKGLSLDALATHCWEAAVLAKRVARVQSDDAKLMDQCFLAGLLHDVGRIILAAGLPEQYARVWASAGQQGQALWQAEKAEFGATHADVGAYLLALWGLPNPIVEAIALQHCPTLCIAKDFTPLTAIHVASAFAHERKGISPDFVSIDMNYLTKLRLTGRIPQWRAACFADES